MILADTSIWVDHLRLDVPLLMDLLARGEVVMHPFVIGELALGGLKQSDPEMMDIRDLPSAMVATDEEALAIIDLHGLTGRGVGYIDVHLLVSAMLTPETRLWTRDKRLQMVAKMLGVEATAAH